MPVTIKSSIKRYDCPPEFRNKKQLIIHVLLPDLIQVLLPNIVDFIRNNKHSGLSGKAPLFFKSDYRVIFKSLFFSSPRLLFLIVIRQITL